jgi:catechol 2,3-dioxygenase-like lactoylglutathione lyase family enzyme
MNYSLAVPVISTPDVASTLAYWERTLGFERQWSWGDPPVYAGIKAGGAMIYVNHDPEFTFAIEERHLAPDIFLWVSNIDEVYATHQAQGAEILEELKVRPWGVRQYVVREPNGYHLKIAESDPEN